jgi:YD repeat-containing protein
MPSFPCERPVTAMKAAPLLMLVCALAAHAEAPPVDPWTDAAWQDVLSGLAPGKVARVQGTQHLFNVAAGTTDALSTRDVQLEFDAPGGRVSRLVVAQTRRGESSSRRSFRYVYDAGLLRRVDEDGQATPAVTRRYDDAGRAIDHLERTGAVVARTTWRHDAAGRLEERIVDSGTGSRMVEARRYRRDGTLERLETKNGALSGRRIEFDTEERPVRILVTDTFDRHETAVTYPSATEAIHATTGFALTREGAGRYEYSMRYRVRAPQELRGVEAPELPTLRRSDRGTQHSETQTDYDARGRVVAERELDGNGQVVCTARVTYHPAGPPLAARSEGPQPGMPCGPQGGSFDNEITTDDQGHWTEQRITVVMPNGQRRLMSVQTRRIEVLP